MEWINVFAYPRYIDVGKGGRSWARAVEKELRFHIAQEEDKNKFWVELCKHFKASTWQLKKWVDF